MTYTVLLIDDEPSALEGMLMWIPWEELGLEVCGTCGNGQEGLRQMQALRPDLVITDVNMPLMNGLEMISAWQQEGGTGIKFAILSGYSEFEYAQTAIRYGISHYLLKPVFPEEAAEELRELIRELEQEKRRELVNKIAFSEEAAACIKGLLLERGQHMAETALLDRLSEGISAWNIALIQCAPELATEIRARTLSLLDGTAGAYFIDLEGAKYGIVYGAGQLSAGCDVMPELLITLHQEYSSSQLHTATGFWTEELIRLADSYHAAKEALRHYFYRPQHSGVLAYQEVKATPFSRDYDHLRMMDGIMGAINTLDLSGFIQAVRNTADSFREELVEPEAVKKFVIHIMYKMMELVPENGGGQRTALQEQFKIPEIQQPMITLPALMGQLSACGESVITLLREEQDERSHGIVREINRYIGEHYRESLSIQKLAEVFYLHPVYLGQLLIKKNGMTFNEQLHNLRIREAALLLRESQLKLSDIAERVGYSSYSLFLKHFEKKMQMGPNEYRNAKF
ncbi:DNA-binding response regulator [Paenibacillus sp. PK3_47]|uniref:response regulator transcription factor n=1 Tax=Paenibacillus sp. PK3_47 TaxID=2072642 RepID=UPI00201E10BB|nr:response regulator [Paenibacillus sp. PK3_47]UQZ33486.1 DNA-binding response regulator [Paenibacillus sp. PK3_47]